MENFVVCISNEGYPASLESRKIYESFPMRRPKRAAIFA